MEKLRMNPSAELTGAGACSPLSFGCSHSIEFLSPQYKPHINDANRQTNIFSASKVSVCMNNPYYQTSNALPKEVLQSSDHGVGERRTWDPSADSLLQPEREHSLKLLPEFLDSHASLSSSTDYFQRNDPFIQLNHGNPFLARDFGHLSSAMDSLVAYSTTDDSHLCEPISAMNGNDVHCSSYFGRENITYPPGGIAATEKRSTSPIFGKSIMQQRTLEPVVTQKEIFSTWSVRDNHKDSDRIAIAKPRVSRGTIAPIVGSFKGGKIDYVSSNVENGATVKTVQDEGVTMPTFEDGNIGLRLGKRIYYGDAGVGEEISRQANAGTDCSQNEENGNSKNSSSGSCITTVMTITSNSSSSTSSSNSNNTTVVSASPSTTPLSTCAAGTNSPATVAKGSNGIAKNKSSNNTNYNGNDTARNINGVANAMKKQKGSTSAVVPACQAEGCTADLSEAKDYHRRHKVCEWHSKASRAKVNNMEQRFCQQCSRFHQLSAFDEGKRSCRRRLAGHNERRRKPPPEPMPFLSPGGFTYYADGRFNAALCPHPYFLQNMMPSVLSSTIDDAALASQIAMAGLRRQESLATSLFPHVSSEMTISGRALSLLSSSLGSPETKTTSLGKLSFPTDQFLSDSHGVASMALNSVPQSHIHSLDSFTSSSSSGSANNSHAEPSRMSNFWGAPLFSMKVEDCYQNVPKGGNVNNECPILDLMHVPSVQPHHHDQQSQAGLPYSDLQGFSIFSRENLI